MTCAVPGDGWPVVRPGTPRRWARWAAARGQTILLYMSAVLDHTAGLAVSASSSSGTMPSAGAETGCSSKPSGGMIPGHAGEAARGDVGDEVVGERRGRLLVEHRRPGVAERGEVGHRTDLFRVGDRVVERRRPRGVVRQELPPLTPTFEGLYTFQWTPASSSTSCIVVHVQFHTTSGVALVSVTGPPCRRPGRSCRCWPSGGWGGWARGSSSGRRHTRVRPACSHTRPARSSPWSWRRGRPRSQTRCGP